MSEFTIRRLRSDDLDTMRALNALYAEVFEMPEDYAEAKPSDGYLKRLLARDTFIALVAEQAGEVIGGLCAYVHEKFEQERTEVYIYDLAVLESHRRKGAATTLIKAVKPIARDMKAWIINIQADLGDTAPVSLYSKLGSREDIHHFDISVFDD